MKQENRRINRIFQPALSTGRKTLLKSIPFAFVVAAQLMGLSGCASKPRPVERQPLVLMTDFGLRDGAVSAMRGVAYQTDSQLVVTDLTHEIPNYSIWDAAYRLQQTYAYWPAGTVFVTVVDPGVGSDRRSVAVKSKSGHIFVGPDNGLTTLIADENGIESVMQIDESKQRLKGSEESYTFHGRDLYVYVGARLASGKVTFGELGTSMDASKLIRLTYQKAEFLEKPLEIRGAIPVLDPQFGNVWTNIPKSMVQKHFLTAPTSRYRVRLLKNGKVVYDRALPVGETFAAVKPGQPLLYFNSLLNLSVALNQANFADKNRISSGPEWTVIVTPQR